MSASVFFAVLGAAVIHAVWNALIKVRLDRFTAITLMTFGIGAVSLGVLPFVPAPPLSVLPFILLSSGMQNGYRLFLAKAYEAGDLAQTYALARGGAPLLVALAGLLVLPDRPSGLALAGVALLSAGTLAMSLRGGSPLRSRAVAYALTTSVFIAGFTLADGHGVRLSASALGYAAWLFSVDAAILFVAVLAARGPRFLAVAPREWAVVLAAGLMGGASYAIAVWAMTRAPVASVAALRETAILFAVAIATLFLKETLTRWRLGAALLIVAGVIALRLG